MDIFTKENIKKGFKSFVNQVAPPKTPGQLAYEKRLAEATLKARQDSYLKEAIKQSHIQGRQNAQKKYSVKKSGVDPLQSFASNLESGLSQNHLAKKSDLKKKLKKDDAFNKLMFGG